MADELLAHYTPEQLRMHFMSLGLSAKSVGFKPQVYMSQEEKTGIDMVLKEGNLLTNVYNRLIRSCLYAAQNDNNGKIPSNSISQSILDLSEKTVLEYERHMYNHDLRNL